jgi:hypothetical protein
VKVFIDKPLNLRGRLDILVAAFIMRDFTGWWPVMLRGRTGPLGAASNAGPAELVIAPGPELTPTEGP